MTEIFDTLAAGREVDERCATCAHVSIDAIPAIAEGSAFRVVMNARPAELVLHCQRYPPHARHSWPRVHESDWCGEWAERTKGHLVDPCPLCSGEGRIKPESSDYFSELCNECGGTGRAPEPDA